MCKYGRRQSSSKLKNVGLHASRRADQWRVSFHEFNNLHPSKNPLSARQIPPDTTIGFLSIIAESDRPTPSFGLPPSLCQRDHFTRFYESPRLFPTLSPTNSHQQNPRPKADETPSDRRPNGPMSRRGHRAAEFLDFSHKPVLRSLGLWSTRAYYVHRYLTPKPLRLRMSDACIFPPLAEKMLARDLKESLVSPSVSPSVSSLGSSFIAF